MYSAFSALIIKNNLFCFSFLFPTVIPIVKLKSLYSYTKSEKEREMVISSPTNFEHTLHVHLNLENGEFIVNYIFIKHLFCFVHFFLFLWTVDVNSSNYFFNELFFCQLICFFSVKLFFYFLLLNS